jgi:hypothetical protein
MCSHEFTNYLRLEPTTEPRSGSVEVTHNLPVEMTPRPEGESAMAGDFFLAQAQEPRGVV